MLSQGPVMCLWHLLPLGKGFCCQKPLCTNTCVHDTNTCVPRLASASDDPVCYPCHSSSPPHRLVAVGTVPAVGWKPNISMKPEPRGVSTLTEHRTGWWLRVQPSPQQGKVVLTCGGRYVFSLAMMSTKVQVDSRNRAWSMEGTV